MSGKKYSVKSEEQLIFCAKNLTWHAKKLLVNHPEVATETCKECSKDHTCADSLSIAIKQLKDIVGCFEENLENGFPLLAHKEAEP